MRDGDIDWPDDPGGYYSITSNRMVLYDRPLTEAAWFSNSTVIMHEATHQLAFNVGIHQRLSQTPLWVAEGLASLFEAKGYFDPMLSSSRRQAEPCSLQDLETDHKQARLRRSINRFAGARRSVVRSSSRRVVRGRLGPLLLFERAAEPKMSRTSVILQRLNRMLSMQGRNAFQIFVSTFSLTFRFWL